MHTDITQMWNCIDTDSRQKNWSTYKESHHFWYVLSSPPPPSDSSGIKNLSQLGANKGYRIQSTLLFNHIAEERSNELMTFPILYENEYNDLEPEFEPGVPIPIF